MNNIKDTILLAVKARQSVHHDALVAEYGAEAASAVHDLYMANLVGLRNSGLVYFKL